MLNFYDVIPDYEDQFSKEQIEVINDALKLYFPEPLANAVEEIAIDALKQFIINSSKTDFGTLTKFMVTVQNAFYVQSRLLEAIQYETCPEIVDPILHHIASGGPEPSVKLERTIIVNDAPVHLEIDLDNGELAYRSEGGTWEVVEL